MTHSFSWRDEEVQVVDDEVYFNFVKVVFERLPEPQLVDYLLSKGWEAEDLEPHTFRVGRAFSLFTTRYIQNQLNEWVVPTDPKFTLEVEVTTAVKRELLFYLKSAPEDFERLKSLRTAHGWAMTVFRADGYLRGKGCAYLFYSLVEDLGGELSLSSAARSYRTSLGLQSTVEQSLRNKLSFAQLPELKEYQIQSIDFLLKRKRCMLAAGPGTGKTFISIAAAWFLQRPVLVVTPLTLKQQWEQAMALVGVEGVVVNPEALDSAANKNRFLNLPENTIVILDESSLYRNRKTKRFDLVRTIAQNHQYVWLLTGTPIVKHIDNIWAQLNIIDRSKWPSYWNFVHRFCIVESNQWGTHITGNLPGADEKLKMYLQDVAVMFRTEDVLTLPDWSITRKRVAMEADQEKVYRQSLKELRVPLLRENPGDQEFLNINSSLAMVTRSLQIASNPMLLGSVDSSAKWKAVLEAASSYTRLGEQGLIWYNYQVTGLQLEQRLTAMGVSCRRIDGTVKAAEREMILAGFEQNVFKVLLLNPSVAKFGLNLQRASFSLYAERTYDQEAFFQSMYRVKRMGTSKPPTVVFFISELPGGKPTIDSLIDRVLNERTVQMNRLMKSDLEALFS